MRQHLFLKNARVYVLGFTYNEYITIKYVDSDARTSVFEFSTTHMSCVNE